MPIANINTKDAKVNGRFTKIYDTNEEYADALQAEFENSVNNSGNDHFVSTHTELVKLLEKWDSNNPNANIDNIMNQIQSSPNLYSWFIAVLCAFMYGCDGTNSLDVHSIPIEGAGSPKFLKLWKEKFVRNDGNDNDYNGNTGFCMVSFGNGNHYSDWLGCYSKEFFLIPLKEYNLTYQDVNPWKQKFNALCQRGPVLKSIFTDENNNLINRAQRVILKLTADSIPVGQVGVPKALELVRTLIHTYITTNVILPPASNVGFKKRFGDTVVLFELFRLKNNFTDSFFSNELYVGMDDNQNVYTTYPFSEDMIRMLEDRSMLINNMKIDVNCSINSSGEKSVIDANIDINYSSIFVFEKHNGDEDRLQFRYDYSEKFGANRIYSILHLPTLCMYPNLPLNVEKRCKEFTYLSNSDSSMFETPLKGIAGTVELQNDAYFECDLGEAENKILFKGLHPKQTMVEGRTVAIKTQSAAKCSHFISVFGANHHHCGYIVNINIDGVEKPAILKSGQQVSFDLNYKEPAMQKDTFYAFVDFGSSSSCMKYRVGDGALHNDGIIEKNCTMRMLLAQYVDSRDYKYIVNNPNDFSSSKFPSVAVDYDASVGFNDYYLYKNSWMPLVKRASEYERVGVHLGTSNKTALTSARGASEKNPNIIISNICYIIACNAIINNCREIIVVPSLPSSTFQEPLSQIWTSAIQTMCSKFDFDKFDTVLKAKGTHFLYESVAISYNSNPGVNTLNINVDIGDSTTDMTAIYVDSGSNLNICGYSSVNYAGKQLIKETVKNIAENTMNAQVLMNILNGQIPGYGDSLFDYKQNKKDYAGAVSSLIGNFYNGTSKRRNPENFWENNVVEILNYSSLRDDIDQKVAANFIARYLFLLPVIKDFINTAIAIAPTVVKGTNVDIKAIKIDFYGGAGEGLNVIKMLDTRPINPVYERIESYFDNAFNGIDVKLSVKGSGKDALVDGLSNLEIKYDASINKYEIHSPAGVTAVNWDDINPGYYEGYGRNVHKNSLNTEFVDTGSDVNDETTNKSILRNPMSYFDKSSDQPTLEKDTANLTVNQMATDQFLNYFKNEIYGGLINNGDGKQDSIEALFSGFVDNASSTLKGSIGADAVDGNAFNNAITISSIYPEMIKNAIFMFTAGDMLTAYHGEIPDVKIVSPKDAGRYPFGG